MDERAKRVGENEALFREVNEQIEQPRTTAESSAVIRVVCECGEQRCVETLELEISDYEAVRADPERFVIKPGHEIPEVEEVVDRQPGYWVVAKGPGAPARIARRTNPRRNH